MKMDEPSSKEIKRFLRLQAKAQEKGDLKEESECCNVLGIEYLKRGDCSNALIMHKSELSLCQSLHDITGEAIACRNIGDVYVAMAYFDEAIQYHSKHLELSFGNDIELQRANTSLGRTYLEYGRTLDDCTEAKGAFIKSIQLLKESLRIVARLRESEKAPQKETNEMKIRSLINLGLCFHHLSNISKLKEKSIANEKSEEFFEKAMYLAKKFSFTEDLYLANYILTTVHSDQKQFSAALRNIEEALSLAKTINKSDLTNQALDLCAQIHLCMENIEGAKLCLKKLYKRDMKARDELEPRLKTVMRMCRVQADIKATEEDELKLYNLHETLADLYCSLSCYHPAVKHYKMQEDLLPRIPTTSQQERSVYFSVASTLSDAGDYEEAVRYYYKEIECTSDATEHTKTYTHIADCLEKMEADYSEITATYEKALKCSADAKDDLLTLRTLIGFEEAQKIFDDREGAAESRSAIGELELKLGVYVAELKSEEEGEEEAFRCVSPSQDEEMFQEEMALSDEDEMSSQEPARRRRKTQFTKTNEKGETQLHRACIEGQLKFVEVLVKQGHPVNPRDFCGWIPLHEACNHGYEEIVRFLIDNGAHVNDTGGQHCDNITPINDAAINGHFQVVELLLDAGANPNIPTKQGKVTLDSLSYYYHRHKEDLDVETKQQYKTLYRRLKSVSECSADDVFPAEKPPLSALALVDESEDSSEEEESTAIESSGSRSLAGLLDDDLPSLVVDKSKQSSSGRKRNLAGNDDTLRCTKQKSRDLNTDKVKRKEASSNSHFVSAFDSSLRDSSYIPLTSKTNSKPSSSKRNSWPRAALTADDAVVDDDDWLVDDDVGDYEQPIKKRKASNQPKRVEPSQCDWTDFEFDRQSQTPFAPTPQIAPVPQQPSLAFRLRVKVKDRVFMFAVPERDKTISWLTDRAAARFEEVTNLKPNLTLSTSDGCLLSPGDAVRDVLCSNDTVIGNVESWRVVPFAQVYAEACAKEGSPVLPLLKRACESCQLTKTFQLLNLGYSYKTHLKPLLLSLGQQDVQRVALPGNRLGDVGMTCLCSSFNGPSPIAPRTLVELNLACCGLQDETLKDASQCQALNTLKFLDLSYNPLRDGVHLVRFLSNLNQLETLNLESCALTSDLTEALSPLKRTFENLRRVNLSKNTIGVKGLDGWTSVLHRPRLRSLVIDGIIGQKKNGFSFLSHLEDFISFSDEIIELINLSNNNISTQELAVAFKSVEHLIEEIVL